ncbi:MAG TPA: ROK family protein, partial [Saprospiraceae bacterium]|nr:ROK family protein [Saprospiraceae bacterium]
MKEAVIGMDIGGTNTDIALVDKKGLILSKTHLRTTDYPEFDSFANQVAQDVRSLTASVGVNLKALGIGAPNGNYYSGMIEFAPNLAWKGKIDVAGELYSRLELPVFVTNDANAAAIGEMKFGVAGEMNDFVMITLGTGVGSGVVANGQLIYGHDGFAGEIGHMTSTPGGRLCGCGRKGCLETYSSVTGLRKSVVFMHEEQKMAGKLENIPYENLTGKMIEIAALEGDVVAKEAFRLAGKELGKALANVAAVT